MRALLAIFGFSLVLGLAGCSSPDQEKAKAQAREDVRKASEEAKKAGRELKENARELGRKVDAAVQPDSETASDKMAHAEVKAKDAAARAGVKLEHAALLAKVKARLASEGGLSTLTEMDVTVDGSVVTLTGTVASEDQKKAVETAAAEVDGVTKVRNRLRVEP